MPISRGRNSLARDTLNIDGLKFLLILTHRAKKKSVGCLQEVRDGDAIRTGVTFFQRVQRVPQSALPHQFKSSAIKPFIHIDFTGTLLYLHCDRVSELFHARNQ